MDVHEFEQRSVHPGSHLDEALTCYVCRRHHSWIDAHVAEAHELGLLVRSSFERTSAKIYRQPDSMN